MATVKEYWQQTIHMAIITYREKKTKRLGITRLTTSKKKLGNDGKHLAVILQTSLPSVLYNVGYV